jgi:hypothetical protein
MNLIFKLANKIRLLSGKALTSIMESGQLVPLVSKVIT